MDSKAPFQVETPFGPAPVDGHTFTANVLRFARLLRRAGLEIENGQTASFLRAMLLLGFDRRADVRAAGRAIFVRRREDQETYEAAFDLFWRPRGRFGLDSRLPRMRQEEARESPSDPAASVEGSAEELVAAVRPGASSAAEQLRTADFGTLSPEEARDAQAMVEALRHRLTT